MSVSRASILYMGEGTSSNDLSIQYKPRSDFIITSTLHLTSRYEYDLKLLFLFSIFFLFILYIKSSLLENRSSISHYSISHHYLPLFQMWGIATILALSILLHIFVACFFQYLPQFQPSLSLAVLLSPHKQTPAHKAYLYMDVFEWNMKVAKQQ